MAPLRRSSYLGALLLALVTITSAFLPPIEPGLAHLTSMTSASESSFSAGEEGKPFTIGSIFKPPPTYLGEKINGFFGRLLKGGQAQEVVKTKPEEEPLPKRRTGGPVSLVFGATGKAGREVVQALLAAGHDVIAAVRNETKAMDVFGEQAFTAREPASPGYGLLEYRSGIDVTKGETLGASLFDEVDHVVLSLGPVGGPKPGGGFGFLPGLTSEDVDYKGVVKVIDAFKAAMKAPSPAEAAKEKTLFSFQTADDVAKWQPLDDVIMGGRSSSFLELSEGYAEYKGELVVEDGGFCGTRAAAAPAASASTNDSSSSLMDLSTYDGIRLQVMGDGNRYKLNLKTVEKLQPENVYQVAFDTMAGQWTTIDLPFDRFLPVVRNRVNYKAPGLGGSKKTKLASSFGLVYSRVEFNRQANPYYKPGPFSLKIKEITAYQQPRPSVVLISSAGAERNAKVETEEERKAEIPIVQLNPGGILNWKYKAETYLRSSGLPYTILRACGLVPDQAFSKASRLQASQGDVITGRLTRQDLAQTAVAVLSSLYTAYKTLEIRRDENDDAMEKATDFDGIFKPLIRDVDRAVSSNGLLPFPEAIDPPGDVSPQRRDEILNDPRVQANQQRERALAAAKEEGEGSEEGGKNGDQRSPIPATAASAAAAVVAAANEIVNQG